MLKLVTRGIRANLGRLILTLISVVLGVAFVSGSFVLADSLRSIFNNISETAFAGVDAQVRAIEPDLVNDGPGGNIPIRFEGDLAEEISQLSEVEYSEAGIFAFEQVYSLKPDGELNRPTGPPVFTTSWGGPSPVNSFNIIEGTAPVGQQVALDSGQFDGGDFELGQMLELVLPTGKSEQFVLSAIVEFEGGAGAYFLLFDLPTTQRILNIGGKVDSIVVNAVDGVSDDQLVAALQPLLGEGLEAVPGKIVIGESQDDFGSFISIIGNVLLGFAGVVLFVSTFIIYNTFAILVGQRTKQLGLLRSLGASSGQVRSMVLIESVIIGLFASIIGLLGGIGVAWLLKQLFNSQGGGFPDGPLQILPRTIVVVMFVGMFVTVASALLPAFRASRVSPLEAIREGGRVERSLSYRIVAGAVVLIPGLAALGTGMFGGIDSTRSTLTLIGLGAALTFIGVAMVSALFAGPVANVLGAPVEGFKGVTGRLARDNAARNPQRTTATATALMIGLALITGVAVLTTSLLSTLDSLLEDSLTAELFVYEENNRNEFSPVIIDQLRELPETDQVAGSINVDAAVNGEAGSATAFDTDTGTSVINYGIIEGSADLGPDGIAAYVDKVDQFDLSLGDTVSIEFIDGFTTDLTVKAIYDDLSIITSQWVVDRGLARPHLNVDGVGIVGITYAEGVDAETAQNAVKTITTNYPQLTVQDNSEYQETLAGQISQLQVIINALLVLCLIVAFFGIVNTMALSVLERTREIGLLRAVGMTRKQLKTTVRWEAVIVSVFGALLGVLMGLLLGWAAVVAIPDSFISKVDIPWAQIVLFVVVGAIIGVIAAYFPARRASKLNILDAIATD
ncbi:MAG: putative ABC transport system permease protein [Acidimicrobiales bacterium]